MDEAILLQVIIETTPDRSVYNLSSVKFSKTCQVFVNPLDIHLSTG
ncbi:MAG: hypothetical protein HZC38_04905 [Chloroflexi bacterium]|nr:hypothetical protein [Chloroflexota bacterium]